MNWTPLETEESLNELIKESFQAPQLIFKHSTRCSISHLALSRLEREWSLDSSALKPHYLDLLKFRNISNLVASEFQVEHQSPQALIIKNGVCAYSETHNAISSSDFHDLL